MPRIYDSESNPMDFCKRHMPTEAKALVLFGNPNNLPQFDGPDGRGNCFGYDAEHPDYAETEEGDYLCTTCTCQLTGRDN